MTKATTELSLVGLVLLATACGGSNRGMQPEVPPGMTTTTAATTTRAEQPQADAPLDGTDFIPPAAPEASDARSDVLAASPAVKDSASASPTAAAPLTDAEIAGVAEAATHEQRQEAREAMRRARSQRVRQLAHLLLSDRSHGRLTHVESVLALTPADNATSAGLRLSQTREAETLRAASDDGFDRAYVSAQVNELRQFSQLLDDKLIPQAQSLELKQALQELRAAAASHLGMAADIQSSILK